MNPTLNNKEINKKGDKSESSVKQPIPLRISPAPATDWKSDVAQHAGELDQSFRSFTKARPVATTLIAVGIGLLGAIVLNKIQAAKKAS